jgi:formylglycine-generating enzyme required for sulfatase activity
MSMDGGRKILLGGLFLVLGLLLSQAIGGAEQRFTVTNTRVNLRSGPTTAEANIITTVPQGTEVVAIQQQGSWYQVRLPDGREGWISGWVLTPVGGVEPAATPTQPPTTRGRELRPEPPREVAPPSAATDDMVFITVGNAIVGSDAADLSAVTREWPVPPEALTDELPKQILAIRSFSIDRYEVTNAQYNAFVEAARYPPPLHWQDGMYAVDTGDHPVTFVSWDDAREYCTYVGKRLPTAEEWEVAARGMDGQIFPWGAGFAGQQVNVEQLQAGVAPVGSHPDDVSPFEVYDLGGNVMEWTMTQYGATSDYFILKGSSWATKVYEARGANQTPGQAVYRLEHIGFRCVQSGP